MNINYDIKKLERVIGDFANIAGLSIAVIDIDFNYLIAYSSGAPVDEFCTRLQRYDEGKRRCTECDRALLEECKRKKCFVAHTCHAGICDAVMPVIKDGILFGYIMLGRMRKETDYEKIREMISWCEEKDELSQCFCKVSYYDEKKVESAANLAVIIASYILLGDMIKLENNETAEKITEYISENLQTELTVDSMCKKFNISKNKLYEIFRNSFNLTVNEYITKARIQKAVKLLKNTQLPVYEVAEAVGIENYPYFCRLFKSVTGKTPLEVRRRGL